jgi:hypothetical protein
MRTSQSRRCSDRLLERLTIAACLSLAIAWPLQAQPADVNGEPAAKPNGDRIFRIQGQFSSNADTARENTLRAAQEHMREWLASQPDPVHRAPSIDQINREMKTMEFPTQEEKLATGPMYRITMEFNLQAKQVRALRERDRLSAAMGTFVGVMGLLLVASLFVRLIGWTKGLITPPPASQVV